MLYMIINGANGIVVNVIINYSRKIYSHLFGDIYKRKLTKLGNDVTKKLK